MVSLVGGVLLLGLGTLLFKPQEIPKYSRVLGRFCGKSLKLVMEAKSSLAKSKDSEILQMKKEFDFMMSEVSSVRGEIRKGFNLRSITNGLQSKAEMEQQFQQLNQNIVQNNSSESLVDQSSLNVAINNTDNNSTNIQQTNHEQIVNMKSQASTTFNNNTQGNMKSTMASTGTTAGIGSNLLLRNIGKSTLKQTSKPIIPSFSSAFAELQEMERQNILNDPELRYPDFDQSKWNTYDYDKNPIKLTNTYPDLKESPFSVVEFGHKPIDGLYDETSVGIRTEVMGSGADLVSINVLESIVSENFPNREEATKLFNNK